ncbi:uncharacterized protein TRIADDRAFT_59958 [Trichoplax adhaerens]|uniref:Arrestin C-terminal-like domain-containing protein n=1 Tax=Trichoplax adhaerens TaxID=10228 RepID=B3S6W9_TRIAD|nr:hypothetical protein TRIADDRAFT_59958 [Trichoplax adhaerens]EDV21466.1 hypothetical protein TRIADDRAFT_59958 [Trichoplax adhaerens]|eukprot:XP_002116066.1 hypothetical protein TRIADDRAFT_59958 [Trichoplax adhaerens]
MVKNFAAQVNIHKDPAIFVPGQSVTGCMVINVRNPMKVRGIRIRILGEVNTCIKVRNYSSSDNSFHGDLSYDEIHRESETYIDRQFTVWGNEIAARHVEPQVLPSGRHQFDFDFEIPLNTRMPSSFALDDKCSATYKIIGKLVIPDKGEEIIEKKFIFLEAINVTDSFLSQPTTPALNETTICCCCCESDPIKLNAWLDHGAYRPGDTMILNAECHNNSIYWLRCIRAKLYRKIQWNAKGHSRKKTVTLFDIESPIGIIPERKYEWKDHLIQLKQMPPSITSFNLFSVSYEMHIYMEIPYYNGYFEVVIPVVIGTLPLPNDEFELQGNIYSMPQSTVPGSTLSELPPSYDEVVDNRNSSITTYPNSNPANVATVSVEVEEF